MAGQVYEPGEWGRIFSGGASLEVDGAKVDLIYCDLDEVARWESEANRGRFEIQRNVGYVAGVAGVVTTYLNDWGVVGHEVSLVNL